MTKVEQDKNSRIVLHVVIAVVIVLILAVFIGVIVISLNGGRSSGPIKPIENQSESDEKKDEEKSEDKKKDNNDKKGNTDDKTDPGDVRPIKGEITSAGLSGNNISVRVRIGEALDNAACKLTLTGPQQQTYSQTVNTVVSGDSAAICNGFDIPLSSLNISGGSKERKGEWQVVVDVTYGSRAGNYTAKFTL